MMLPNPWSDRITNGSRPEESENVRIRREYSLTRLGTTDPLPTDVRRERSTLLQSSVSRLLTADC